MRIGIFTECYPPVLNGVAVSTRTLIETLEKKGHHFFVFTTQSLEKYADPNNVTRISMLLAYKPNGGKYPIAWPQNVEEWAKKIAPYNLDLIHSQYLLGLGALGLKVAQKLDLPRILTYHTLLTEYVHYVPLVGFLARDWIIYKSRRYCNQYNTIVAPSPAMKKLLISYGVKVPITVIPTGIKLSHFKNQYSKTELKEKYQIPAEHDFLFLSVGRVGKEKNVYFLLDAMQKLVYQHNRRNAHLLIIGGGDELEKVRKYAAKLKIVGYVTFAGAQAKEETNKIFGGADVFVFASGTDTQGIIIQEAFVSGLPVIAVNKMGPGDYVHDGEDGLLVPPLNFDQFADKMKYLMDHDDIRAQMSAKARENVKEFTAEKCGDKMEDLYERTVNQYHHGA